MAGVGRLTSASFSQSVSKHTYKLDFGFDLTKEDIVHIYHEPNWKASYYISVMMYHSSNNLAISLSNDNDGRKISVYRKTGEKRCIYFTCIDWALTSAFATSSRDISNLWNPKFTDVTDTISLDDLEQIW